MEITARAVVKDPVSQDVACPIAPVEWGQGANDCCLLHAFFLGTLILLYLFSSHFSH